ncbi:MAG: DegT/DnrJ/EryC1/StrS family aminotransferase [Chitinophagaceae bacterium]
MINVTKTFLPSFDTYIAILKRAWDKSHITNNGILVQELEQGLKEYLGVKHLFFTSNGTVVLQMALKAYNISKEVITTPFSYVATTNAILWENCTPVFVDINRQTFCIDADKIERAITEDTQAIMATHVYGYPCDVEKIQTIADKHKLKVIYDGAHAFGCVLKGKALLSYGDISTCSFHATKLFHTVEGGCMITDDDEIANKLMLYRQFGHINDDYFSIGINGKNSEFHAAMGLSILPQFDQIVKRRKEVSDYYDQQLSKKIYRPGVTDSSFTYNYSYYPIVFESEEQLVKIKAILLENGYNTRRYFYPSLNELPYSKEVAPCPVSEEISRKVLCLPTFFDLEQADQKKISEIINQYLK